MRFGFPVLRLWVLSLFITLISDGGMAQAQLSGLVFPGRMTGGTVAWPTSVSGDGKVVAGSGDNAAGGGRWLAFRWTAADGMVSLGALNGGTTSGAWGISDDGSVIVGESAYPSPGASRVAYRWTAAGGMVSLGPLDGSNSQANGVSRDGSVVVGYAGFVGRCDLCAFRWAQSTGMMNLGTLDGGFGSVAYGVSGDGSVVVGVSYDTADNTVRRAFRWTQAAGMASLGVLGAGYSSEASNVSSDGLVVVGATFDHAKGGLIPVAFRWTQNGGMVSLGLLKGGTFSTAQGISGDGAVVVGAADDSSGRYHAIRWTQAGGLQTVANWLRAAGVKIANDDALGLATATNRDGSVVVGIDVDDSSTNPFIARVSAAGSGKITLADVQQSLGSAARAGDMLLGSAGLLTDGAHSRPLSRRVAAGQRAFWVAGDAGRDDHSAREGHMGLAEVGLGWNFNRMQVNASLGQTWSRQSMPVGGRVKSDGTYVMAEALLPVGATSERGLWAVAGGYVHWGDTDLRRGYLNAGGPDASVGQAGTQTWMLRGRLEWDGAYTWRNATVSPYTSWSYARARLDGFTETNGGFPARFDARREQNREMRLGVNVAMPLHGTRLVGVAEHVHRFEKSGNSTSGEMVGLFAFNLPGQQYQQNWLRTGWGVERKLAGGVISVMLNATTKGGAPNAWLATSWRAAF